MYAIKLKGYKWYSIKSDSPPLLSALRAHSIYSSCLDCSPFLMSSSKSTVFARKTNKTRQTFRARLTWVDLRELDCVCGTWPRLEQQQHWQWGETNAVNQPDHATMTPQTLAFPSPSSPMTLSVTRTVLKPIFEEDQANH